MATFTILSAFSMLLTILGITALVVVVVAGILLSRALTIYINKNR